MSGPVKPRGRLKQLIIQMLGSRVVEVLLGAGLLVGAAIMLFLGEGGSSAQPKSYSVQRVVVVGEVKNETEVRRYRFASVLRSRKRAQLSFTVSGRLLSRPVEVGDRVKKGQVLASIDSAAYFNGLGSAVASRTEISARLSQARRDLVRIQKLVAQKALPRVQLEHTESNVRSLDAMAKAARARVSESFRTVKETRLRAPFDGIVTEVGLQPGELATPGRPVVFLNGKGGLELMVEVGEEIMLHTSVGQIVRIAFPMLQRSDHKGMVKYVGRTSSGPGRLFPVVVALDPAGDLQAGMTAEVTLEDQRSSALTVPVAAVVNPSGQSPTLYLVRQGRVHKVSVKVSSLIGDRVAVEGPLQPGEKVIVSGHGDLLPGDGVQVRQ